MARKSAKRGAFQVQVLLFPKDHWTIHRAKLWAERYGHRYGHVEESDAFIHLRQHDPADYQKGTLHNSQIAKHVEAVVGIPKTSADASQAPGWNTRGPRQRALFSGSTDRGREDDLIW